MLMVTNLMSNLFMFIFILVGVAFVTLLERKILGFIHCRVGPSKVGYMGLVQPLSDALKLFSKSTGNLILSSWFLYNLMPFGTFVIMMILWGLGPLMGFNVYSNGILLVLCMLSLGVYPIMLGGWFSGSLYSMIGAIRSIAQMISFEVSFIMVVICYIYMRGGFSLKAGVGFWGLFMLFMMMLLFLSLLIELNRTPSDLIESESELVSGFNTEYWGLKFSVIFLGEYGMIMFMSGLFSLLVLGVEFFSFWWVISSLFIIIFIILIRGALPRIRYDSLMYFCWVSVLSSSLGFVGIAMGLESYLSYF